MRIDWTSGLSRAAVVVAVAAAVAAAVAVVWAREQTVRRAFTVARGFALGQAHLLPCCIITVMLLLVMVVSRFL